jgi:predicted  nucleic acid-binding Zn-ribbon protein
VREQFRLLGDLQRLDTRLRTLANEQDQLPQKLRRYEQTFVEARERFALGQAEIEQAERQRRSLERELETDQERLVKTQGRLHEIKTNKEYNAVLAEIEGGKHRITVLEDRVLELMETIERQRQDCQEREQLVQAAKLDLEREGQRIAAEQQELAQQVAAFDRERQELLTHLDMDIYTVYQRTADRSGGLAAVYVVDGSCEGCYLRVRPQLISELRRQESIVTCPHCQRVLLWPT